MKLRPSTLPLLFVLAIMSFMYKCRDRISSSLMVEKPKVPPFVVIFTTFSDRDEKMFVYQNTIRNWASFLPHIQPVMYTTFQSGKVIDEARENGWLIYPNPRVNEYGCPVLKDMYLDAYKRINATFYGYVNGDILFDFGLNQTLSKMKQHLATLKVSLLFGIRRNHDLKNEAAYVDDPLWPPTKVHSLINSSKIFRYDAFDYFFVTRCYPFKKIKDLVIARGGFDTYFVARTNQMSLTTIDGTNSIAAIHQTDQDGNLAHNMYQNSSDVRYNRNLIGKKFQYSDGFVGKATYKSEKMNDGSVVLKQYKLRKVINMLT